MTITSCAPRASKGQSFYRTTYLRSEHWKSLRLEKLASVDAVCINCGIRDLSNDVHHLRYKKLYDVGLDDLVVLCRRCHDLAHEALELCREKIKSSDNTWEATKRVLSIIENGKLYGVDCSFLKLQDYGSNIRGFWKKIKAVKNSGISPEYIHAKAEMKFIKKAMAGCLFPSWKYSVFDKSGRLSHQFDAFTDRGSA